ncbi:NUDIX domain-containing protein [Candidatus Jorgensenbacteria bacterium]|nr:NUDIX domain-containing protein [Candidatus Jorgensenbacteria bacterium]
MVKEISAGIIIYRKTSEGIKFLLLYHGGRYWNFPKGKLDQGEKSFRAALREVKEETGLSSNELRLKEWFKVYDRFTFTKNKEKVFKIVMYYLAETDNPIIKISSEHHGYGWFLLRDALRMLMYPNLKSNLKKAYDNIIRKKSVPSR